MNTPPPDPDSKAEEILDGILQEIAKFEHMAPVPENGEKPAETFSMDPDQVPASFTHVRNSAQNLNPIFLRGVEFAQFSADQKLESVFPDQLPGIPEIAQGATVAVRDSRRKMDLVPGENLASKAVRGQESYVARVKGRLIAIGSVFHLVPSDMDGKAVIHISSDNMAAHLDLLPGYGNGLIPSYEMVETLMHKAKISHGIKEREIREALQVCISKRRKVERVLAALGTMPVAGKPGSIEYFFDHDFQGPVNLTVGPDGKIDFRNVTWIPVVAKDHLLARVTHEIAGLDGNDIFGHVLPALQPPRVYLVAGKNVRCDEAEREYFSEINGCVQLNGTLLDVMNVFVVNSDVDYNTGNIHFLGNVLITGGVTKGFEVEAEGDVLILKGAEPCRIKAGRDLFIKGGLLGGGKGEFRIEAGRDIGVGYAENAWIEAQRDIRIDNYALQSLLYSCGHIILGKHKGSIIGGETMAAKGLEVKTLGSPAGIKTMVGAGVNFMIKRKLAQLEKQRAEIHEAMEKVDHFLKALLELAGRGSLPPSKAETLKTIVEKRRLMSKAQKAILVRMAELEAMQNEKEAVFIRVSDTVHPEVILSIRNKPTKITQAFVRSAFYFDAKEERIMRRSL